MKSFILLWLKAALSSMTTCQNPDLFQGRINEQMQRYGTFADIYERE